MPMTDGSKTLNFTQIIESRGGSTAFADEFGYIVQTVTMWKHRNNIPAKYWLEITDKCQDITLLMLAEAAALED